MKFFVKTYTLVLFLSLGVVFPLLSQTAEDAEKIADIQWETKQISENITYRKCDRVDLFNSLQSLVIAEIDTTAGNFSYQMDCSHFLPVSEYAKVDSADVAINGTFFFLSKGGSQHYMKVDDQVCYHTLERELDTRATGIITISNGKIGFSDWNREKEAENRVDAQYAMVSGNLLILNEEYPTLPEYEFTLDRHPRSCVGITKDGKLLLMVIDGRQPGKAEGMNLFELRFFAKELGCIDALNLDGGGSTALFIKGEGILNTPIDENIPGKERSVGNILYLKSKK